MSDYVQVSTTVGSKENAERLSNTLLEDRLAACVQVIGPIESTYRWNDDIVTEEEWMCLIKTATDSYDDLEETIDTIHPYDIPEIIATEITAGSEAYLRWLGDEVSKE